MRRERTNNIIIFIYSFLAVLLVSFLFLYIYLHRDIKVVEPIEHPQVGEYLISGQVTALSLEERLLVIDYENEEISVGLLSDSQLLDKEGNVIELSDLSVGNQVEVEVDFIGTGAVLASQVRLID